jgi:hypothetical protein
VPHVPMVASWYDHDHGGHGPDVVYVHVDYLTVA